MTERVDAQPQTGDRCAACGTPLSCGADDPAGCWCLRLPALPAKAITAGVGCLCEPCLQRRLAGAAAGRAAIC